MCAARLRLFFASDIHGSDICFRKFLGAAEAYKADVLILGGDITGKFVVPVFERQGRYEAEFSGQKVSLGSRQELERFLRRLADAGCYPYVTSEEEWRRISEDRASFSALFTALMRERLSRWISYAEERLRGKSVKCFVMPGNDDEYSIDEVLGSSGALLDSNEKLVELSPGLEMLSLGYSNITPWRCPRDIGEEELWAKIEELVAQSSRGPAIFNVHVPPFDSGIDSAPELDEQMRPKLGPGGQPLLAPVGSRAVRRAIELYQPLLGLHGHIHEARGFARIGRTLCLNPGSEYQEGILRGALIQLDGDRVSDFLFTAG
jgi:Icc-related predicted phosphoesterase